MWRQSLSGCFDGGPVMPRNGYSVQITRKDGTTFLCSAGLGLLPPVWTLAQRRFAVAHKRDLVAQGFKARVVRVVFADVSVAKG
jgi:hypothetical protein